MARGMLPDKDGRTGWLIPLLSFAGVIPFAAGAAILAIFRHDVSGDFGWVLPGLVGWGLAILSFMAGTQWGMAVARPEAASGQRLVLLLASNAITIAGWASLLFAPLKTGIAVVALGFLMLLLSERAAVSGQMVTPQYWRMRVIVTALVVLCLGAAMGSAMGML